MPRRRAGAGRRRTGRRGRRRRQRLARCDRRARARAGAPTSASGCSRWARTPASPPRSTPRSASSRGDHVLILNPDCVMDPGCAAALRARLRAQPEVGLAAALLRDPDGTPQLFARRDLRLAGALLGFTSVGRRIDARRGGRALAARRYEELWAGGPPREPVRSSARRPRASWPRAATSSPRRSTSASRCSSTTATSARGWRAAGAAPRSSRPRRPPRLRHERGARPARRPGADARRVGGLAAPLRRALVAAAGARRARGALLADAVARRRAVPRAARGPARGARDARRARPARRAAAAADAGRRAAAEARR